MARYFCGICKLFDDDVSWNFLSVLMLFLKVPLLVGEARDFVPSMLLQITLGIAGVVWYVYRQLSEG